MQIKADHINGFRQSRIH